MELFPPLRARSGRKRQKDYKWILSARHNINIQQYNKAASQYSEDLISCAFRLRTTRRPYGTNGRASANSTAGPEELPLLASPSASLSTRGSRPPWSRCYAEPGLCEPSLLRQQRWGGGGLAGECRVAAGSCGTVLCVPAEGFQLAVAEQSESPTKRSRILTSIGAFHAENNSGM
jgi:hypothetical protein